MMMKLNDVDCYNNIYIIRMRTTETLSFCKKSNTIVAASCPCIPHYILRELCRFDDFKNKTSNGCNLKNKYYISYLCETIYF